MKKDLKLSKADFHHALSIATLRMVDSLDRTDSLYDKEWVNGFTKHLLGAIGEVALAKWTNTYLPGDVRQFSGMDADIAGVVEVRHRRSKGHQLIVRESDPNERLYVLTRGCPPDTIEIVGGLHGESAKREEWKADYGEWGEAYFVPDGYLESVMFLKN